MNVQSPSMGMILNFVNSFHEQCRNMVRDAVRLLRDEHQVYVTHEPAWDYAVKPNDRFLAQEYSMVRRAWATFLPGGDIQRGAIFVFDFFHPRRPVEPSLIFGTVYPGSTSFAAADRWASYNTIVDPEKRDQPVTVDHDGPFTVVSGTMPQRFEESVLVRVPLEGITDHQALQRMVVSPLAALLRGERAAAKDLLSTVPTEPWPAVQVGSTEEEEDDSEKVKTHFD